MNEPRFEFSDGAWNIRHDRASLESGWKSSTPHIIAEYGPEAERRELSDQFRQLFRNDEPGDMYIDRADELTDETERIYARNVFKRSDGDF